MMCYLVDGCVLSLMLMMGCLVFGYGFCGFYLVLLHTYFISLVHFLLQNHEDMIVKKNIGYWRCVE